MQLFNIEADPREETAIRDGSKEFLDIRFKLSQHIRKSGAIPWQKR
jgi:hypothetical protein